MDHNVMCWYLYYEMRKKLVNKHPLTCLFFVVKTSEIYSFGNFERHGTLFPHHSVYLLVWLKI